MGDRIHMTTKIEYMKKRDINFNEENASQSAIAELKKHKEDDNLVVKISINSPVYIEAVAPLTKEGIISICKED